VLTGSYFSIDSQSHLILYIPFIWPYHNPGATLVKSAPSHCLATYPDLSRRNLSIDSALSLATKRNLPCDISNFALLDSTRLNLQIFQSSHLSIDSPHSTLARTVYLPASSHSDRRKVKKSVRGHLPRALFLVYRASECFSLSSFGCPTYTRISIMVISRRSGRSWTGQDPQRRRRRRRRLRTGGRELAREAPVGGDRGL
jgi:hypothetical protein